MFECSDILARYKGVKNIKIKTQLKSSQ